MSVSADAKSEGSHTLSNAVQEEDVEATRKKKIRGVVLIRKLVPESVALEINSAVLKASYQKNDDEADVEIDVHPTTTSGIAEEVTMRESMRQLVLRLRSRGAIAMISSTYIVRMYRSKHVGDGIDMPASVSASMPTQCDVAVCVFLRAARVQIDDDEEMRVRPGWIVRTAPRYILHEW